MNILPLNFLQHIYEDKTHKPYQYCTAGLYCHNVANTNTPTIKKMWQATKENHTKKDRNAKINVKSNNKIKTDR